jgi:hypothetical protein
MIRNIVRDDKFTYKWRCTVYDALARGWDRSFINNLIRDGLYIWQNNLEMSVIRWQQDIWERDGNHDRPLL